MWLWPRRRGLTPEVRVAQNHGGIVGAVAVGVVDGILIAIDVVMSWHDPDQDLGKTIAGGLMILALATLAGGIVGAWIGRYLAAGTDRRAVQPLRYNNDWSRVLDRCRKAVARYHDVVDATAEGPTRDWLASVADELDEELVEAVRLARFGQANAPDGDHRSNATAREIMDRLTEAERSFDETVKRATKIALTTTADTEFEQIRAQLEILRSEAPHLRSLEREL